MDGRCFGRTWDALNVALVRKTLGNVVGNDESQNSYLVLCWIK